MVSDLGWARLGQPRNTIYSSFITFFPRLETANLLNLARDNEYDTVFYRVLQLENVDLLAFSKKGKNPI